MIISRFFSFICALFAIAFVAAVAQDFFHGPAMFPEMELVLVKIYRVTLLGGTSAVALFCSRLAIPRPHVIR